MFSLETEMHARYVCDMSSVQHSALRGYVRAPLLYVQYEWACVWVCMNVLWVWLCTILLLFVTYFFWLKRQRCLFDANASLWRLALALPG